MLDEQFACNVFLPGVVPQGAVLARAERQKADSAEVLTALLRLFFDDLFQREPAPVERVSLHDDHWAPHTPAPPAPPAPGTPAFTYPGPPTGGACSPSCNGGALGSGDYVGPIIGSTQQAMPYFRWKPLAGYASYFVLVSRDPEFSNLVDYAFTRVNAYAPRTGAA